MAKCNYAFGPEDWDVRNLPDWNDDLVNKDDILAFASALSTSDLPPPADSPIEEKEVGGGAQFITALNDWRPVRQRVRRPKVKKKPRRGKDETREGWTYCVVKYPFLFFVLGWIVFLGAAYLLTRLYIYIYEQCFGWHGKSDKLRRRLREQTNYSDWVKAAKDLDRCLGNDRWKERDEYAYYDHLTIRRATEQLRKLRGEAEGKENGPPNGVGGRRPIDELRSLVETCVKNNFAGFENPKLYSETYYGTKVLVQRFIDELSISLRFLKSTRQLTLTEKSELFSHLSTNFGRTALCLSGGATFAYYHFGIAKALLDAELLPKIVTGTSGGALVAALLATRTDEELKRLLIPALASRITACSEPFNVWLQRWWRTGARFDSIDWARLCSWMTYGSLTFREAYLRTGRILNVSCVPSDPHSPAILANYLTAPDCVIWSAVLASAAVPGILNPVVLMRKNRDGRLEPYSFGHKWKDGSLRTDIPLKSLNLHFNVNFSIVSQVNPHIKLFFFSSRGTVGRPVTHRRGRGWRGGFLGSAIEQYLKLDLNKWLKVLRQLELLPRPLGQDWSEVWLQRFRGTITVWPKTQLSDFYYILSDPDMRRLARMLLVGQQAAWPKLKFIENRMDVEKVIRQGVDEFVRDGSTPVPVLSAEDLQQMLSQARERNPVKLPPRPVNGEYRLDIPRESFGQRVSSWLDGGFGRKGGNINASPEDSSTPTQKNPYPAALDEIKRQSSVFWDDEDETTGGETTDEDDDDDDRTVVRYKEHLSE